jgi:hypothetical protein
LKYALFHKDLLIKRSNIDRTITAKSRSEATKLHPDRHVVSFNALSKKEQAWFDLSFIFGEWTAIENLGLTSQKIKCRCSCGAIGEIVLRNLRSGHSTRCKPCADKDRKGRPTIGSERQTNAERYQYQKTKKRNKMTTQAFKAYSRINDLPNLTNEDGYSIYNEVENIDYARCSDDGFAIRFLDGIEYLRYSQERKRFMLHEDSPEKE